MKFATQCCNRDLLMRLHVQNETLVGQVRIKTDPRRGSCPSPNAPKSMTRQRPWKYCLELRFYNTSP